MNNYQYQRQAWLGFYTLVRREITRFMRIWTQTLLFFLSQNVDIGRNPSGPHPKITEFSPTARLHQRKLSMFGNENRLS